MDNTLNNYNLNIYKKAIFEPTLLNIYDEIDSNIQFYEKNIFNIKLYDSTIKNLNDENKLNLAMYLLNDNKTYFLKENEIVDDEYEKKFIAIIDNIEYNGNKILKKIKKKLSQDYRFIEGEEIQFVSIDKKNIK